MVKLMEIFDLLKVNMIQSNCTVVASLCVYGGVGRTDGRKK